MKRWQGRYPGWSWMWCGMLLVLAGCGEGPGNPHPPSSPPRPMTEAGAISHADLVLHARPVPAPAGMM